MEQDFGNIPVKNLIEILLFKVVKIFNNKLRSLEPNETETVSQILISLCNFLIFQTAIKQSE